MVKPGGRSKITISSVECRAPKLAKEKWIFSPKSPSWSERKVMLSKAVEVGVRECFRNHLYTFNGQVYRQTEGGPIGLRLSMAISRLVMAMWDKMLMKTGFNNESSRKWLIPNWTLSELLMIPAQTMKVESCQYWTFSAGLRLE